MVVAVGRALSRRVARVDLCRVRDRTDDDQRVTSGMLDVIQLTARSSAVPLKNT